MTDSFDTKDEGFISKTTPFQVATPWTLILSQRYCVQISATFQLSWPRFTWFYAADLSSGRSWSLPSRSLATHQSLSSFQLILQYVHCVVETASLNKPRINQRTWYLCCSYMFSTQRNTSSRIRRRCVHCKVNSPRTRQVKCKHCSRITYHAVHEKCSYWTRNKGPVDRKCKTSHY